MLKLESKVIRQTQNIEDLEKKMKMVARELDMFQNELLVIIHHCVHVIPEIIM